MNITITRTTATDYRVDTDVPMSDGSMRADGLMQLQGNVLRSANRRGFIRVGWAMAITLGPDSLASVSALNVGQSYTYTKEAL